MWTDKLASNWNVDIQIAHLGINLNNFVMLRP